MNRTTSDRIHRTMKAVKSSGTRIEKILATNLWSRGYRYRKNDKNVFGKPDFTFRKIKIAIFVDGDFWHGKDWNLRKYDHKTNAEYWITKIEKNIFRDKKVNEELRSNDWDVLRFWGTDIEKNLNFCLTQIEQTINEKKKI